MNQFSKSSDHELRLAETRALRAVRVYEACVDLVLAGIEIEVRPGGSVFIIMQSSEIAQLVPQDRGWTFWAAGKDPQHLDTVADVISAIEQEDDGNIEVEIIPLIDSY